MEYSQFGLKKFRKKGENVKNFLIWCGCVIVLMIGVCISIEVCIYIDDLDGNIVEGGVLPLFVAVLSFGLFIIPASYLYGRYVIEPNER